VKEFLSIDINPRSFDDFAKDDFFQMERFVIAKYEAVAYKSQAANGTNVVVGTRPVTDRTCMSSISYVILLKTSVIT